MNPLSFFRRYQSFLLVVFGVVLMVVFTIGGYTSFLLDSGPGYGKDNNPSEVLAEYNGGEFQRGDVEKFRVRHYHASRFIQTVAQRAIEKDKTPKAPTQLVNIIPTDQDAQASDQSVMRLMLLSDYGEKKLGITMTDDAVYEYLGMVGDATATRRELAAICLESTNRQMSIIHMLRHLKHELVALNVSTLVQSGVGVGTGPLESWVAFEKLNRKATCEFYPVDVDVTSVTGEPTESEIKALYEEGKYDYPDPTFKKPGFKAPRKLNIAYIRADDGSFMANATAKVTEEEIVKEYQRWKERKDPRIVEKPVASVNTQKIPEEEGDRKSPTEDLKKPSETPKAEDKGKAGTDDKKQESTDKKPESADKSESDDKKESSESEGDCGFQDETKADETKADETKQDEVKKPAADAVKPEPIKFLPLTDSVKDQIRRSLAPSFEIIQQKKAEAVIDMRAEMEEYSGDYNAWKAMLELDVEEPKPEPFDLDALASKYGLSSAITGKQSFSSMQKTPFGKTPIFSRDPQNPQGMSQTQLATIVFSTYDRASEFVPDQQSVFGTDYLYWITEKIPPGIQKLEDCREEVIEYWKYQKAIEAAKEKASKIVGSISKDKITLKNKYGDDVETPIQFSWMNTPKEFAPPQVSNLFGISKPSDDMMSEIFSTKIGDAGYALNADNSVVYVFQVTDKDASAEDEAELQALFFQQVNGTDSSRESLMQGFNTRQLAFNEQSKVIRDWYEQIEKELGVKWIKP